VTKGETWLSHRRRDGIETVWSFEGDGWIYVFESTAQ
jgi:hypothetical protein